MGSNSYSRYWKNFTLTDSPVFRRNLLSYLSESHSIYLFLDSCYNHIYGEPAFNYLCAGGAYQSIHANHANSFETLKKFYDENKDWIFGYFGYDLKNEIENLSSENTDHIQFSNLMFLVPLELIIVKNDEVRIGCIASDKNVCDKLFNQINKFSSKTKETKPSGKRLELISRISREEYLEKIKNIQQHIVEGDVYELNFCQEFYAEKIKLNPAEVFDSLCQYSKAPFSCLLRYDDKYLISASPERFLKKENSKIISQPIKGTIKRGRTIDEDERLKNDLLTSEKDRAENIMIVDLVRNDLTKYAKTGTVKVEELCGVYSFEHVHHMVSTVSAELKNDAHIADVIKHAFPMGSMTGAPKVMAMKLIEQYEETKRGLFSGSVGYFSPNGDFDFNVVIRSILYNAASEYLSIQVGSAITYDSIPEDEYEECLIKLEGLKTF